MVAEVDRINHNDAPADVEGCQQASAGVERLDGALETVAPGVEPVPSTAPEEALPAVEVKDLRTDQLRAYQIILWHLEQILAGAKPPALRMIVYGEGGTGKSRIIQTVTEAFAARNVSSLLLKSAYTGTAASLIDGKTTHTLARIPISGSRPITDEVRSQLQAAFQGRKYLIIDEYSMLVKSYFAVFLRHIAAALVKEDGTDGLSDFNIILFGDLHQFPPIAVSPSEALFKPVDTENDPADRQLGRKLYEEFSTVVILKEQMRVVDGVWHDFLTHLRFGEVCISC